MNIEENKEKSMQSIIKMENNLRIRERKNKKE